MSGILRVALADCEQYAPARPVLDEFEQETGIGVRLEFLAPAPEIIRHVGQAEPGSTYDLVSLNAECTASFAARPEPLLLPLDEWMSEAELAAYLPDCLEACRWQGRLYQLPRRREPRLLYYRSDLFDDRREQEAFRQATAGRELAPPDAWTDLAAVAQFFKRPGRAGFVMPGRGVELLHLFCEIVAGAGGAPFEDDRVRLDGKAAAWALALLADLHRRWQATPEDTPEFTQARVSECFRLGRAALALDGPATGRLLTDPTFSAVAAWHSVALPPGLVRSRRASWSSVATYALPATCSDPAAALRLLRHLTSEEAQRREAADGALPTRITVRREALDGARPGTLAHRKRGLAEAAWTHGALRPPASPGWLEAEATAADRLHRVLAGDLDPAEVEARE